MEKLLKIIGTKIKGTIKKTPLEKKKKKRIHFWQLPFFLLKVSIQGAVYLSDRMCPGEYRKVFKYELLQLWQKF